jgi:hypothetical protein
MSKKLIAVASAAALALSALVAVPANAAGPDVALTTTNSTGSGTAAAPYLVDVPAGNKIQVATDGTAITFVVGGVTDLAAGDVVTATASGSVKLLLTQVTEPSANFNASTLGVGSLSSTRTDDSTYTFHAYTTSATTTGTVVVSISRAGAVSSTVTTHIEGVAGPKHTVTVTTPAPALLASGLTATVKFTVADVFGNPVVADADAISASNTRLNMGAPTWSTTGLTYESVLTSTGSAAFVGSLDIGAADVAGMPDPNDSIVAVVNSTTQAAVDAQVASLTAQVAALQVIVDRKVTKKRYNTLARKWNRAFPSQKVWVKP